jgi:hypothetical protein
MALLLRGPMVATIAPLLAWLVEISAPLFAWLVEIFLGLGAYRIAKSCLGPFVYCGKCGTSCS